MTLSDFQDSQKTGETILVDFYAPWCGPCMAMMPMLEDLSAQIAGRVRLLKVDVDKNIDLALEQKIMGVPTFVLYRQGREIWRHSGVLSKSELLRALDTLEI